MDIGLNPSYKQDELIDGPMGLVYIWNSNSRRLVVISLFTHYQRIYGEKYEVKIMDGMNEVESDLEPYTSDRSLIEKYVRQFKNNVI